MPKAYLFNRLILFNMNKYNIKIIFYDINTQRIY